MPNGLLIAGFNYRSVAQDEFNDWYDTEHVPERSRVTGFLNCQRWLEACWRIKPRSIATYDLSASRAGQSRIPAIVYEKISRPGRS